MCVAPLLDDRRNSVAVANELLAASGALPSDKIIIAGAEQLELLIAFLRRGFSDVACQSAACGPHARAEATDLLIIPSVRSESDLLAILGRLGCSLRARGMMVMRMSEPFGWGTERRLRQMLLQAGFCAIERRPRRDGIGDIWCAHKPGAAVARAA